ncbi:hypothetical protein [Streptomyces sp. PU-14G]|uniref:hypothetical protein n=1 Tax=Streptomyces sp. PU-14G TaxID=2800808 RepID=UPI0034DF3E86
MLDQADDLTGQTIGFLSYGSGNVAEFFAGTVVAGHREHLRTAAHREAVERRKPIGHARYRALHERSFPSDGEEHRTPAETTGPFRLAALRDHKRIYETRAQRPPGTRRSPADPRASWGGHGGGRAAWRPFTGSAGHRAAGHRAAAFETATRQSGVAE